MNDQFDELAKGLAQSVTRRAALKKFGIGLIGIALACFGLASKADAGTWTQTCTRSCKNDCAKTYKRNTSDWESCWRDCWIARGCSG